MRIVALVAALLVAACSATPSAPRSTTISVFAAASLTDSFKALGDGFRKRFPNIEVRFNFAGSPTLVTQIEQGAPADVFASADTTNMEKLQSDGFTMSTPLVFAHNQLEIAVASDNPKHITSLADLARPDVIYISAGPTVPAGKYAQQVLQKAGVAVTPKSLETDVKSVISKIELGEADAGIVYTTDVKAAADKVEGVAIPDRDNVVATYPIAVVKDSKNNVADQQFIEFVLSLDGQSTLGSYGFLNAEL